MQSIIALATHPEAFWALLGAEGAAKDCQTNQQLEQLW